MFVGLSCVLFCCLCLCEHISFGCVICLLVLSGFVSMHVCVASVLHVPFLLAFGLFHSIELSLAPCMVYLGGMILEIQNVKSNCGIRE